MKFNLLFTKCLVAVFSILMVFSSCNNETKSNVIENDELLKSDTLQNDFAKAFQIIHQEKELKINVLNPENQEVIESYYITKEEQKEYHSFSNSIQRVVTMSTSHIGFLRKLHLENKIVGVTDSNLLCQPLNQKDVVKVGEMGMTNPEAFMKVQPGIIFYSGFNLEDPILKKMEQAHLKTFLVYEWQETHPLGRAEWIKVFGAIFNKEKEATSIFNQIKTEYNQVANQLKNTNTKPTMFAGTYFGDIFNAPAGDSYMAQLFKDASVDYVYSDTKGTGSLSLTLEETITQNIKTDFWLNAFAFSINDLLVQTEKFKLLDAVKSGRLYSYAENLNCFFENSVMEPQSVLKDLGKIFHPELFENYEMEYYSVIEK